MQSRTHSRDSRKRCTLAMLAAVAGGIAHTQALAQTFISYSFNATGNWNTASNWSPNTVPNAAGVVAQFGLPGASSTVTNDVSGGVTLDGIQFNGASNTTNFTISGNAITLVGAASINVASSSGTGTITSNIITTTLTKNGSGTLNLGGTNSFTSLNIQTGTVVISTAAALPTNTALVLGSSAAGTLSLGAIPATLASISMPYNNLNTASGGVTGTNLLTLNGDVSYTPNYGSAGSLPLVISVGSIHLGSSNRTFDIEYNNNSSGDVQVSSPIRGSGGIIKTGSGTLALNSGAGTFSGGVDVQGGNLILGAAATGSPGAVTSGPAGTGAISLGTFSRISGTSINVLNNITGNGDFLLGIGSVSSTINFPGASRGINFATAGTINGSITGAGATALPFGNLVAGSGTILSSQSYTFPTTLNSGTLVLLSANGVINQSSAVNLNNGTLIYSSATSANRFNDTAAMNMAGGTLVFSGSVGATYTEAAGNLNFTNANSYITVSSTASGQLGKVTFTDVSRSNRATGAVGGTNMGRSGSFGTPSGTTAYVKISGDGTNENTFKTNNLVGGGAAYTGTSTTNSIVPWLLGFNGGGSTPNTFVTYEGTDGTTGSTPTGAGFINLNTSASTNYAASITSGATSTNNVRLTTTNTAVSAPTTINSLWVAAASPFSNATGLVTITSGALAADTGFTITSSQNPLEFGTGGNREAIISVFSGSSIASTLKTSVGVTKAGSATLSLRADNSSTWSGDLFINAGTIDVTADSQLGASGNNIRIAGGGAALAYTGTAGTDLTIGRTITVASTSAAGNKTPLAPSSLLSVIAVPNANTLTLTQPIDSANEGGFVKLGAGSLTTGIASTNTGLVAVRAGTLTLSGNNSSATGTMEIGTTARLRVSDNTNFTGGSLVFAGGTLVTSANAAFSKPLTFHSIGGSTSVGTIDSGTTSVTFSGNTQLSGVPGLARVGGFGKAGTGTLVFTGAHNSRAASYTAGEGALIFGGAGGSAQGVGSFIVSSTGKLVLDNTTNNTDRIANNATISLASGGAEFILRGNASATASETVGALILSGGGTAGAPGNFITLDPNGSTGATVLTFSSLSLTSFALFRGINLGVDPSTLAPGTPYTQIFFSTAPTLSGGVISGARYDSALAGLGIGSATYSSTFGIQLYPQTTGAFIDNINNVGAGSPTPTNTNYVTNAATTANLGATINSLEIAGHAVTLAPSTYTPQAGNANAPTDTLVLTSGNLTTNTGPSTFSAGAASKVQFGSSGTSQAVLFLASQLTVDPNVTFVTTGGLNKTGGGTLIFNGTNSITGLYSISDGSLVFNTGATASGLIGTAGTVTIGAGQNFNLTGSGSQSFSGTLNGSGNIVTLAAFSGTQILSGTNTGFTGAVTLNGGALIAASANALGPAARTTTTVNSGASVGVQGAITMNAFPMTINGAGATGRAGALDNISGNNSYAGAITLGSAATIGSTAGSLTLSGGVTAGGNALTVNALSGGSVSFSTVALNLGATTLTKTGGGGLILPNLANTLGNLDVNGGLVRASADNNLGAITNAMNLNGGGFQYGTAFAMNAARSITLGAGGGTIDTNSFSPSLGVAMSGPGAFTKAGTGVLTLGVAQGYGGSTSVIDGTLTPGLSDAVPTSSALTLGNANASAAGGVLALGGFNQTVSSLTLVAPSSSTTRVSGTGVLTVNGPISFINNTVDPNNDFPVTIGTSGSTILDLGGGVRNFNVAANANTNDLVFNTVIQNGGVSYTGTAGGSSAAGMQFTAANTFTGGLTVNSGILNISSTGNLGGAANLVTINSTGAAGVANNSRINTLSAQTIGGLAGTRGGAATAELALGGNLIVNQSANTVFEGAISGSTFTLTKSGGGTLKLTGNNTYTGATTINGGALFVSNTTGNGITSAVTVGTGGTLGGTGTYATATTVNSGGTIAPGESIGTLTIGALSLGGIPDADPLNNSTISIEVNESTVLADKLMLNNGATPLNFNGTTLRFVFVNGTITNPFNQSFVIVQNAGTATPPTATPNFELVLPMIVAGFVDYALTYVNNDGGSVDNDVQVTFTAVPEPSALGALALGGLLLCRTRRTGRYSPAPTRQN